jgi:oligosaccharide repeat unit polymerase
MIYVPFIWFLGLSIYLWRKQQCIDVSVFLSLLYALTAFCAILCVNLNFLGSGGVQYTTDNLQLNVIPTFLYCFLHTMLILPFSKINPSKINDITINNRVLFDLFVYFLFAVALLNIYVVADNIIQVFVEKDFSAVREAHYADDETLAEAKTKALPLLLGYFYYFNRTTILALPCFFYSLCFLNKPTWFNIGLIICALSLPLYSISAVDRTEIIFFAQTFCLCFLLFRPFIKTVQWKFLKKIIIPLGIIAIFYVGAITIARWGDKDQGANGAVLQYAGQNYLNFCYFYENCSSNYVHTERMLPLTNKIFKDQSYTDVRDKISEEQGFFISVFATYLGVFLCDTGIHGMLLWALCFFFLLLFTIKKTTDTISFGQIFWYYLMATIPMFGIFYYPYFTWLQVVCVIVCAVMSILFHYKFK